MKLSVDPLFAPLDVLGLRLKNRIVMSPMTRGFSPGGVPGADVAAYYARRAAGETGLIITEGVGIDHPSALGDAGLGEDSIPVLYGEAALAGWKKVVEGVHAAGGVIFPQLWHMGVMKQKGTGLHPLAPPMRPSGVWGPQGRTSSLDPKYTALAFEPTAPMREEDIADVIAAYARSAANARSVGFDGIAIHGAHGYMIDNFLWDETNFRTDAWGGDRKRRSRFAVEVVRAIRAAVGPQLPISLRFSQWKQQDFRARLANTPQELEEVLGPIADAGVDLFEASTRYFGRAEFEGSEMNLAGWARRVTGKLSMAVGGVGLNTGYYDSMAGKAADPVVDFDPLLERFNRGEFDLIEVGRALLHDAEWARKLRTGSSFSPFSKESLLVLA
jgi:2,4-dienoyl-CoA reductase-like NADH-dependent reductase (Old Yellow Enzyme family)